MKLNSPAWRTKKISHLNSLRRDYELKSAKVREMEIEVANLKEALAEARTSELPILLYVCQYKDDDSGRSDYDHLYYLPDFQTTKLDRVTRHVYIKNENLLLSGTLDLSKAFKNCNFPKKIISGHPDFWDLKQKHQVSVDRAVKSLESVIDHFFACEKIESWEHLRRRLAAYYR